MRLGIILILVVVAPIAFGDEIDERKEIKDLAANAFAAGDYDTLEALAEEYRSSLARTSSGILKLRLFYLGIDQAMPESASNSEGWNRAFSLADWWARRYPDSPTPVIGTAYIWAARGWAYRGEGWASEVLPENMMAFKQLAVSAQHTLLESKSMADSDPEWYAKLIDLYVAATPGEEALREVLDEAMIKFTNYDPIYFAAAQYYSPVWHGSGQEIAALARDAVKFTKEERGSELYARIYWSAPRQSNGRLLIQDPPGSWYQMRRAIDDLVERYPDQWNIQNLAFMGCSIGNHLDSLLRMVEEPIIESVWVSRANYQKCRLASGVDNQ